MANTSKYQRTEAEQEFTDWLDSIATPVDTSLPIVDKSRDYPREKYEKQEAHRHRWLMANNFWYRQAYLYHQHQEQLRLEAELEGREYIEPESKTMDQAGFWEQF